MGTHKTCNDIKFLKPSYKNDLTKYMYSMNQQTILK